MPRFQREDLAAMVTDQGQSKNTLQFYDQAGDHDRFGDEAYPALRASLAEVIDRHLAPDDIVLELGCGKCVFQDCHPNYIGLDLSRAALSEYGRASGRFVQSDIQRLPIRSGTVQFVFTINALEHVPRPEDVLVEIDRILKPLGLCWLDPAWFCRPWKAEALHLRSFRELTWAQRFRKLTVPLRDSLVFRMAHVMPRRLWRELRCWMAEEPMDFPYRELDPNLDEYLCTDSDAFVSMDPHAALLFFVSRGYEPIRPDPGPFNRLSLRHEPLLLRKPPGNRSS